MASYREVDALERIFNPRHAHDAFTHLTADIHELEAVTIDYDYATDDKGRVTETFRAED